MNSRKQPPHSLPSEAAILAHLMSRHGADRVREAQDYVAAESFYSGAHRRIFEAIGELSQAKATTDPVAVIGQLEQTGRLAEAGGATGVREIAVSSPLLTPDAFRTYLQAVRNAADRRELLGALQAAESAIYSGVQNHLEFMADTERKVQAIARRSALGRGAWVPVKDTLLDYATSVRAGNGKSMAVSTQLEAVDQYTGGLYPGDLTIVAARPGMGKTSFALGCAEGVALQAGPGGRKQVAGMFSLEMTSRELALRLVCGRSGLSYETVRKGISREDTTRFADGFQKVGKLPFHTDDTSGLTIDEVRRRAWALATRCEREENQRLSLLVVDYLQLMNIVVARHENEATAIGNVTKAFKGLAKELQIPILLLSQLNRGCEDRDDKRPRKSDLRGSGRIEEDADNIWFLYRHEYYHPGQAPGETELIIAKQRGGAPGTVKLQFNGPSTSFERRAASPDYWQGAAE